MIVLGTFLRIAAMLTVTVSTQVLTACPPNNTLLRSFGDGTWDAGKQIQPGTYRTQNPGPHTATTKCQWVVLLRDQTGTNGDVILASGADTAEKPQKVFIPAGRKITTEHCGVWEKISNNNETD